MALPPLTVKWSGADYVIDGLSETDTIRDLKDAIWRRTEVRPERQKLLGLKYKGKLAEDGVELALLKLKAASKIMMMGSREEHIADVIQAPDDVGEVVNDFDIEEEQVAIENREEYLAKIDRRIKDYQIKIINEPRPGKKLLVLDIDYTLFDHRSTAETGLELMRPFLHEFLATAYEDYDIVIWSATGMKWIDAKMAELGVTGNAAYRLCFMVDSGAMISVHTPKYGVVEVKPLAVLWRKFPEWSPKNTIMFDDIRRNFIMNPQSGLRIRPFKKAHFNRTTDRELVELSKYLKKISQLDDFTSLNHKNWENY